LSTPSSTVRHGFCAAAEAAILAGAFLGAKALVQGVQTDLTSPGVVGNAFLHAFVLQVCLYYNDLYEDAAMRGRFELLLRIGQSFAAGTLALTALYFFFTDIQVGRGILLIYVTLGYCLVGTWRAAYRFTLGRGALVDNVLILGTGSAAQQVARDILKREHLGLHVVGFLGEHPAEVGRRLVNPSVIGTLNDLTALVERLPLALIVVALDDRRGKLPVTELLQCRLAGVRVEEASTVLERLTGRIVVRNLRPSWLVFSQGFNKPRFLRSSKRLLELTIAGPAFLLSLPLMGLVALLVKLDGPGPTFYRQERVGEKGRVFPLLKFRTMRADAEATTGPVWASAGGDHRMTRFGRLLRKTRLDELPQLLNVLRGDMSFVGPRPERPHFVEKLAQIIPYYSERHSVKPGITGWAQIKFGYGSNIEDAEEKLQYDLYYIKHMSMRLDLGILFNTMKVMLTGKGAR
jgi:sugar transferase (PEP-CTERM system associated)